MTSTTNTIRGIGFKLPAEQRDQLEQIALANRCGISDVVRDAVRRYLADPPAEVAERGREYGSPKWAR